MNSGGCAGNVKGAVIRKISKNRLHLSLLSLSEQYENRYGIVCLNGMKFNFSHWGCCCCLATHGHYEIYMGAFFIQWNKSKQMLSWVFTGKKISLGSLKGLTFSTHRLIWVEDCRGNSDTVYSVRKCHPFCTSSILDFTNNRILQGIRTTIRVLVWPHMAMKIKSEWWGCLKKIILIKYVCLYTKLNLAKNIGSLKKFAHKLGGREV